MKICKERIKKERIKDQLSGEGGFFFKFFSNLFLKGGIMIEVPEMKTMCPYLEACKFPSDNCTLENAREICELFENFEKRDFMEKEG